MNVPLPPSPVALHGALQRLLEAARQAAARCVDSLGIAALAALGARERDGLLAAQFELNRKLGAFELAFAREVEAQTQRVLAPPRPGGHPPEHTDWDALQLVDNAEVEAQVSADRTGLAIRHACEWELRELDGYLGALLRLEHPDPRRNPLRPEVLGKALVAGVQAVSEQAPVRQMLVTEIGRALASMMPAVYRAIVTELRDSGLRPLGLMRRSTQRSELDRDSGRPSTLGTTASGSQALGAGDAPAGLVPAAPRAGGREGGQPARRGLVDDPADAALNALIRRLARLGANGSDVHDNASTATRAAAGGTPSAFGAAHPSGASVPANLIYAHREELKRASDGALDHMVIDVVGALFEHILSDPRVPPQMARQIARLQLPVLRVALTDASFFSSRRHPVRRFVNRIASLARAFEDFGDGAGREFLQRVRELVEQIVEGDFDQSEPYQHKLGELEAYAAAQARQELQAQAAEAAALLDRKEHAQLQQRRHARRLRAELAALAAGTHTVPDFLRQFVAEVWSRVLAEAVQAHGEDSDAAREARAAARDLLLSVLPKGTPEERRAFVLALPPLMKTLDRGLARIGWPDEAKGAFFAQLLLAHAESLKSGSVSQLERNLLARRLEAVLATPLPAAGEPPFAGELPVLDEVIAEPAFSPAEARQVGLVAEQAVDWSAAVAPDAAPAEAPVAPEDLQLAGLPGPDPAAPEPAEPVDGAALAQHMQAGALYRMHLDDGWHRVRLAYVSPNRAFYAFTRGQKHQRTVSLTARMLLRLCEAGRLRADEAAPLLDRASARARRQLAAAANGAPGPAATVAAAPSGGHPPA
jgi:hypothetical protein